ncbi:MAG: hypothetical protein RIB60_10380 [Phycisphaerales bacterium]
MKRATPLGLSAAAALATAATAGIEYGYEMHFRGVITQIEFDNTWDQVQPGDEFHVWMEFGPSCFPYYDDGLGYTQYYEPIGTGEVILGGIAMPIFYDSENFIVVQDTPAEDGISLYFGTWGMRDMNIWVDVDPSWLDGGCIPTVSPGPAMVLGGTAIGSDDAVTIGDVRATITEFWIVPAPATGTLGIAGLLTLAPRRRR